MSFTGKNFWQLFAAIVIFIFLFSCTSEKDPSADEEQPKISNEFEQLPEVNSLTEKITATPNDPELYFDRARAFFELGNYNATLTDLAQALRLDSTKAEYYQLLGETFFTKKEYTRAVTALEKARQVQPNDIDVTIQLAEYQLMLGERSKAIQLLDEALKQNVFHPEVYFLKGMIFKEIGDTSKAISNFQTAVEQDPQHYDAYMQLGLLFSRKKDPLALSYFDNALKIDSISYEAAYGKAVFHQENNNHEKALELYKELIMEYPQQPDAYYNSGYIFFQMDSLAKAARSFDRAISVSPAFINAYYMRALVAEEAKDLTNARHFYRQALNLNPDFQLAQQGLKRVNNNAE